MNKQFLLALITIFSFSCSNNRPSIEQQATPQEQTPDVLHANKSLDFSSYSKRTNYDIIQQLFEEAVSKDENLKILTSRIKETDEMRNDSLEAYQTYINNNQNYLNSLSSYANQISDSTLKKNMNQFIDGLKEKYSERVSPLLSVESKIETSERTLRDQEILMKIVVTAPMMNSYQRNEYPNIKTLEYIMQEYDSLIANVKPYTKFQK